MASTSSAGRAGTLALAALAFAVTPAATLMPAVPAPAASSCFGKRATIVSSKKTIVGTKGHDVIVVKGGGKHTVRGGGGHDRICGGPGDDRILGERGSDRIDGGAGDDTIIGGRGNDKLQGGSGDDYIDGQKGSDRIEGGAGRDRLFGDKGNDIILGGPGDGDYLDGGLGDESLMDGGPGDGDIVIGNLGTDNLSGGPGDRDVVRGDSGIDTLDGGGGNQDIASFATARAPGVVVNLATGRARGDGMDKLRNIEDVVGSPYDDTITGDNGANRIDGGPGNDNLYGGGPGGPGDPDQGFGGPGGDSCEGFGDMSSCNDRVPAQRETAVEINRGLDGVSLVVTGIGDDSQITVSYGNGAFVVTDPTGVETRDNTGCAVAGLTRQPRSGIAIGTPTMATCPSGLGLNFVLVDAGGGNDAVTVGNGIPGSLPVRLAGGPGNDTLNGGPGNDLLEAGSEYTGTSGNDVLNGGGGNDGLISDPGGDQLNGGDGNDLLVSSAAICQGHRFDGGRGIDTVSYARSRPRGKFMIALGKSGGPVGGCGRGGSADSILSSNESLEGSEGNDVMHGDNGANNLFGRGGADSFFAHGGRDLIEAIDGRKDKVIDCGPGNDIGAWRDPVDPRPRSC